MSNVILGAQHLGPPPWPTLDPFLFCVHHLDHYPRGNKDMGPDASLSGRNLGQDFAGLDGWRMYHGTTVPGFPRHPHRGFETVTLMRSGVVDHSDSLGATARFGEGDVQWMTAGRGIQHSEMFPLRDTSNPNTAELFQLWLNLPARDKMVDPYFTMLWADTIPVHRFENGGATTEVVTVAGSLAGQTPPSPPPNSWASQPGSDLAIWTIALEPGATWTIPAAPAGVHRVLYAFAGEGMMVDTLTTSGQMIIQVRPDVPVHVRGGATGGELLMLQGRPIGEPIARHGPFVMNTRAELQQAYDDYRRTRFGAWSFGVDDPVHPRDQGRFARHADGRIEKPRA